MARIVNGIPPISDWAIAWLNGVLDKRGIKGCEITSTSRSPAKQIDIMYNDCRSSSGVAYAMKLYAKPGQQVVQVFAAMDGLEESVIKTAMLRKLMEVGPYNVSHHIDTGTGLCVFDVAPTSIETKFRAGFVDEVEAQVKAGVVVKFICPPVDKAYHIEMRRSGT